MLHTLLHGYDSPEGKIFPKHLPILFAEIRLPENHLYTFRRKV